jgi:hypothetical protein
MTKKRILTAVSTVALGVGAIGGLTVAIPSFAVPSTSAQLPLRPAAAVAASKLPKVSFLPLSLAQKASTTALADCTRQGSPVTATVVNADGIHHRGST